MNYGELGITLWLINIATVYRWPFQFDVQKWLSVLEKNVFSFFSIATSNYNRVDH